jgi:hypothetical protein
MLALVLLAGAACGGGDARSTPAGVSEPSLEAAGPAPVPLPGLPARGFAYPAGHAVVLTDARGRVISRLAGWRLSAETGMPPDAIPLHHAGRFWVLDPSHHDVVPWLGDTNAEPLAGDARIVHGAGRSWRVESGSRVMMRGKGQITPSADGRLVTAAHIGLDVTDGARVRIPAGCQAGARSGSRWYVLCGGGKSPWVGVLRDGNVGVLAPPLGRGMRSGWFGSYTSARLSPDGRTLLLQYSGQCETPNAFFEPVTGGRPQPVTGEANWRIAPESSALGWTRAGAALVRLYAPACGQGIRPGIYSISPAGGMRRLARVDAEPWGRW